MSEPKIAVVGSINLDIVATGEFLPRPGETVTGATLAEFPGGKGANQALSAQRMGADVSMIGCVGTDANAQKALSLLKKSEMDLSGVDRIDGPTGVALICVDAKGENQISVAPGANLEVRPPRFSIPKVDVVVAQLEVPWEAIIKVIAADGPLSIINLAPVQPVPDGARFILFEHTDIFVVNEIEADFYGDDLFRPHNRVVKTLGADGAEMYVGGKLTAKVTPPKIEAVDTTGAGDCFVGALATALASGMDNETALKLACTAGALAATKAGAQSSFPSRSEVEALYRQTYE